MDAWGVNSNLEGDVPSQNAEVVRRSLENSDVAHFSVARGFANDEELRRYYDELVEAVGTPIDIAEDFMSGGAPTGQRWSEIRYDRDIPDNVAFRYSKNAQPLHTDESYVSSGAGVMMFYCVTPAPSGGETVFVSGTQLVEHLRAEKPELLARLLSTSVRYSKADDYKDQPIIQLLDDGGVELNFNYYCVDKGQAAEAIALNEDFHRFLEDELPQELILPVGLKRGESVAWRDSAVLHGRNAFDAVNSGDRFIWKTGILLDRAA